MALLVAELYDALLDAQVDEAKARKAAEAVAHYDTRFASLDGRMIALEGKVGVLDAKVSSLDSKVTWMGSTLIALMLLTLGGVFTVLYRLASP
jgi:hypothetical protein